MRAGLVFSLPPEPRAAEEVLARLEDVLGLLNADKEEQAVEGDSFLGNRKDYPDWIADGLKRPGLLRALEKFAEFESGELAEWDLDSWYEDLMGCDSWDFALRKRRDGRRELLYRVAEEHYGGDVSAAWLLLAAGATDVKCLPLEA
jgi:hypothetical protein